MHGKEISLKLADKERENCGTTITLEDFMYCMPIRRKLIKETIDIENIRSRLESLALIHPHIVICLKNANVSARTMLLTKRSSSILSAAKHLFGEEFSDSLGEVRHSVEPFTVTGFIGTQPCQSKNLQFIYINKRLLLQTRLHSFMNKLLSRSSIVNSQLRTVYYHNIRRNKSPSSPPKGLKFYAVFIVNIECPLIEYDILLDPSKSIVEFRDWPRVLQCLHETVLQFCKVENITLTLDTRCNYVDSFKNNICTEGQDDESDEDPVAVRIQDKLKVFSLKRNNSYEINSNIPLKFGRTVCVNDIQSAVRSRTVRRHHMKKLNNPLLRGTAPSAGSATQNNTLAKNIAIDNLCDTPYIRNNDNLDLKNVKVRSSLEEFRRVISSGIKREPTKVFVRYKSSATCSVRDLSARPVHQMSSSDDEPDSVTLQHKDQISTAARSSIQEFCTEYEQCQNNPNPRDYLTPQISSKTPKSPPAVKRLLSPANYDTELLSFKPPKEFDNIERGKTCTSIVDKHKFETSNFHPTKRVWEKCKIRSKAVSVNHLAFASNEPSSLSNVLACNLKKQSSKMKTINHFDKYRYPNNSQSGNPCFGKNDAVVRRTMLMSSYLDNDKSFHFDPVIMNYKSNNKDKLKQSFALLEEKFVDIESVKKDKVESAVFSLSENDLARNSYGTSHFKYSTSQYFTHQNTASYSKFNVEPAETFNSQQQDQVKKKHSVNCKNNKAMEPLDDIYHLSCEETAAVQFPTSVGHQQRTCCDDSVVKPLLPNVADETPGKKAVKVEASKQRYYHNSNIMNVSFNSHTCDNHQKISSQTLMFPSSLTYNSHHHRDKTDTKLNMRQVENEHLSHQQNIHSPYKLSPSKCSEECTNRSAKLSAAAGDTLNSAESIVHLAPFNSAASGCQVTLVTLQNTSMINIFEKNLSPQMVQCVSFAPDSADATDSPIQTGNYLIGKTLISESSGEFPIGDGSIMKNEEHNTSTELGDADDEVCHITVDRASNDQKSGDARAESLLELVCTSEHSLKPTVVSDVPSEKSSIVVMSSASSCGNSLWLTQRTNEKNCDAYSTRLVDENDSIDQLLQAEASLDNFTSSQTRKLLSSFHFEGKTLKFDITSTTKSETNLGSGNTLAARLALKVDGKPASLETNSNYSNTHLINNNTMAKEWKQTIDTDGKKMYINLRSGNSSYTSPKFCNFYGGYSSTQPMGGAVKSTPITSEPEGVQKEGHIGTYHLPIAAEFSTENARVSMGSALLKKNQKLLKFVDPVAASPLVVYDDGVVVNDTTLIDAKDCSEASKYLGKLNSETRVNMDVGAVTEDSEHESARALYTCGNGTTSLLRDYLPTETRHRLTGPAETYFNDVTTGGVAHSILTNARGILMQAVSSEVKFTKEMLKTCKVGSHSV